MQISKFIIFAFVMRYVIRAVKYFIYISVIVIILMAILVMLGYVSSDIDVMFRNGWKSVGLIAAMFAAVSAFYPRFGYTRRTVNAAGEFKELRGPVVSFMEDHGYRLEKEEGEDMSFRRNSTWIRIVRVGEDRISVTRCLGGFELEGPSKDVMPLASGLEFKFQNPIE